MTLSETCMILTLVVGILALLLQVASFIFDVTWKISHDKHDDSDKKSK